jgi:hypothetical protein
MLEPRERMLLTTALRPPDGHELDFAVGTTYSLDLLTMLTVPLSFAWFDRRGDDDVDETESVEVLGGLQKYATRVAIFCQGGRIMWPQKRYPQLAFLEESVTECFAPMGGAFHPKVWALRYKAEDRHVVYRMLCLSRNLTTARSWDTILVLDGEAGGRRVVPESVPLADFVAALPAMANPQKRMAPDRESEVLKLAQELRQAVFECPEGFSTFKLWPLGFGNHREWPFDGAGNRVLVVSPFLALGTLERLAGGSRDSVLVSSPDTLRQLARRPAGFARIFTLDDRAVADLSDTTSDEATDLPVDAVQLSGLHAKCYVSDVGANTLMWTGSANATDAAFTRNVEFLVQLTGSKHACGVDKLLAGNKDSAGFRDILTEADGLVAQAVPSEDEVRGARLVEEGRSWAARCIQSFDVEFHGECFDVVVVGATERPARPAGVKVRCWPTTLSADRAVDVPDAAGPLGRFEGVSFEALTTFLAVEVSTSVGRAPSARFVLNLPLNGAPADRRDRILRSLIKDKSRFARYVWMLLSDESEGLQGLSSVVPIGTDHEAGRRRDLDLMPSLFELLLRTLHRHPQRLDDIAGLLKSIRTSADDREPLFPPGFEEVWEPIWAIRERARGEVGQR